MEESKILIGLDLSVAGKDVIEILLDDASDAALFHEIARTNTNRAEILQLLYTHPDTPEDVRNAVSALLHLPAPSSTAAARPERSREIRAQSILQKIQTLSVSERLQLAMKGGREIRGILIKDTNKEVMLGVLDNQKITDTEVEMIARSRSINDEALRRIAKNREWLKNYAIVFALVTNPKTPPGISVGLVGNLKTKDLVILERNKNVPDVVRSAGKRLLAVRKPK